MAMLSKDYIFNTLTFIKKDCKINPKVHLETQKMTNSYGSTKKKINAGGITTPNLKLYYRTIAVKSKQYWHKNNYEDQWNRIEDPDMNPCCYAHLISGKLTKNIWWRKDILFNKYCYENWTSACSKQKLDPCLSPCTSMNSKLIVDLIIRPETLNLV
jgi:hypothetical protein